MRQFTEDDAVLAFASSWNRLDPDVFPEASGPRCAVCIAVGL